MKIKHALASWLLAACGMTFGGIAPAMAAGLVPGTGQILDIVGDDFEDPEWTYNFNSPKASVDLDENSRLPSGRSKNGRWRENIDRGQPDVMKRVPTPEGGLEGSAWSLLMASKATGIPGKLTRKGEQDDVFMSVNARIGRYIPVAQGPSVVVRVLCTAVRGIRGTHRLIVRPAGDHARQEGRQGRDRTVLARHLRQLQAAGRSLQE